MKRLVSSTLFGLALLVFTSGVYAQACCANNVPGDITCDGKLTIADFAVWRTAYIRDRTTGTVTPAASPTIDPNPSVKPSGNVPGTFTLAVQDEFNTTSLDTTKWNLGTPWGGQFSQGEENFTNTDYDVSGGNLNIHFKKRASPIVVSNITRTYDTSMIQSKGKLSVHSGQYIEWRLKPAQGNGFWNIAWIMPNSWPDNACPTQQYEMDVFEHLGKGNADALGTTTHVRNTCTTPLNTDGGLGFAPVINYSLAYHTAGVNWFADHTDIYIDGNKVFTSSKFSGHDEPGFLIMNGFLGRAGDTWAGPSDASTPANAVFSIDYVRVWNRN